MTVIGNYLLLKCKKYALFGNITGKIIVWNLINDTYNSSVFPKLFRNCFTDSPCTAGNNSNFILKHLFSPTFNQYMILSSTHTFCSNSCRRL